jgi:hypothetical protein
MKRGGVLIEDIFSMMRKWAVRATTGCAGCERREGNSGAKRWPAALQTSAAKEHYRRIQSPHFSTNRNAYSG